ncbi:FAD-binding oxidoreductase [Nocardioides marinquilinus]|uniref:FAD-binding oxidoreductase n=1 Tax=Nocardioides marinquilinus TaxID=1210400 RepID=A0ABP9PYC1_9ACTN
MSTATDLRPAAALRGRCELHLPGDPGYDAARTPWNVAVDQRPAAVAVPRTVEEVAAVVRAAATAGLRVAPQSTGHGAAALAEQGLDDVVLLRLHELTGVEVDPEHRTARVAGGTQWAEVVAAAAPHGLTALHGSAPDVAVAGYLLGGGLSFYGRCHGLACSSLVAADVVTADGTLVHTDADTEPELLWALRGGGGNLGVVVGLEIELLPIADVYAGMLLWEVGHAPAVLRAWAEVTRDAPDSLTTSLRVMSFPPLPQLPPFLSGRRLVVVDGAVLEDDDAAAALLAPLRALEPEMDTFARMPAAGLLGVHMDPPAPTPAVSDHAVLGGLDEEAIEALLALVGPDAETSLMFAELRQLGGALARPATVDGALPSLPGAYLLFALAVTPVPEAVAPGLAATSEVVRALAPWSLASRVLNFADRRVDVAGGYDGEDWARLGATRDRLDPDRRVVANHPV